MSAYEMAATVTSRLDAKQGLLDLRSENERLRRLAHPARAGRRVAWSSPSAPRMRARSNGKVRFG